ncbi:MULTISPECIES: hypothetical protein [unclassified Crossiella]|uniref:hypothetical protein n=1 Tax=unclassified Crossiella TaxID=2620835 RepID=UPI001FFEFCDA|nr:MULTISPECIES: hypothetical protein [unclassified Crossiella]MCK2239966.1 hypothetical protein [Crossiella sp. S99.2]MCK2252674.1 hypothetical protein [Crossiella sp. S99.1]
MITPRPLDHHLSTLHWQPLPRTPFVQAIPAVAATYYTSARGRHQPGSTINDKTYARASRIIRRAETNLSSLRDLLRLPTVAGEGTTVCELQPGNAVAYAPLALHQRAHRLATRGLDLLPDNLDDIDELHVVTGSCLASATALSLRTATGRRVSPSAPGPLAASTITDVAVQDELTLYEWESLHRLSAVVGDLVAVLPPGMPIILWLEVPNLQYYLLLLHQAAHTHTISPGLLARWWSEVEARSTRLRGLLHYHLRRSLDAAGRTDIPIRTPAGLTPLEPTLRRQLHTEAPSTDTARLLEILETDPIWARLLTVVRPTDCAQLGLFSYVHRLLRPALTTRAGTRSLTIAVDNPSERRTLSLARDLAQTIPGLGGPVIGLYPMPTLLVAGERATLFHTPITHTIHTPEGDLDVRALAQRVAPTTRAREQPTA